MGRGVLLKAPHRAHTHCTQLVGRSEKSWYLENCPLFWAPGRQKPPGARIRHELKVNLRESSGQLGRASVPCSLGASALAVHRSKGAWWVERQK